MKFGVREICDVVLRAKANQKIGNKIFYKDEPVLYFDTLKTSTMEGAATTVYAQGGRGNSRLVAWEGERTVTFTMEDALISPTGFAILSGAGLVEASENNKIKVHKTEIATVSEVDNENVKIDMSGKPYGYYGNNIVTTDWKSSDGYEFYANKDDIVSIKFSSSSTEGSNFTATLVEKGSDENLSINLLVEDEIKLDRQIIDGTETIQGISNDNFLSFTKNGMTYEKIIKITKSGIYNISFSKTNFAVNSFLVTIHSDKTLKHKRTLEIPASSSATLSIENYSTINANEKRSDIAVIANNNLYDQNLWEKDNDGQVFLNLSKFKSIRKNENSNYLQIRIYDPLGTFDYVVLQHSYYDELSQTTAWYGVKQKKGDSAVLTLGMKVQDKQYDLLFDYEQLDDLRLAIIKEDSNTFLNYIYEFEEKYYENKEPTTDWSTGELTYTVKVTVPDKDEDGELKYDENGKLITKQETKEIKDSSTKVYRKNSSTIITTPEGATTIDINKPLVMNINDNGIINTNNRVGVSQITVYNTLPKSTDPTANLIQIEYYVNYYENKVYFNDPSNVYALPLANGEVNTEPYIPRDITDTGIALDKKRDELADVKVGDQFLIDYYTEVASGMQQIEITPDKFGGNYYLEASTLFRNQDGTDVPANFIIPNCKIQSNFNFTMASNGDPSTFTFTMDAFPDYLRFDKSKKVLAAIQLINDEKSDSSVIRDRTKSSTKLK